MTVKIKRIVIRFKCWWFGCDPDYGNAMSYVAEDGCSCHTPCKRCDNHHVDYSDMVGDTRHNRFKDAINYWMFRKWWPKKCSNCGHRFRHNDNIDHIPF